MLMMILLQVMLVSCTKDLTLNPYTTIIKQLMKGSQMTDITKYRNVSLSHETYKTLISLSKVLLPDAKLSISKTIDSLVNEKAKKYNGKLKKA